MCLCRLEIGEGSKKYGSQSRVRAGLGMPRVASGLPGSCLEDVRVGFVEERRDGNAIGTG